MLVDWEKVPRKGVEGLVVILSTSSCQLDSAAARQIQGQQYRRKMKIHELCYFPLCLLIPKGIVEGNKKDLLFGKVPYNDTCSCDLRVHIGTTNTQCFYFTEKFIAYWVSRDTPEPVYFVCVCASIRKRVIKKANQICLLFHVTRMTIPNAQNGAPL